MQQKEFRVVQCRMMNMTEEEAAEYLRLHKGNLKEDKHNLSVSTLTGGG